MSWQENTYIHFVRFQARKKICACEPAFFHLSCFTGVCVCVRARASSLNSPSAPYWACVRLVEAEKSRAFTHSTLSFTVALWWKFSLQQFNLDRLSLSELAAPASPAAFSRLSRLHVPAGSAQSDHKVALTHRKPPNAVPIIFILH